MPKLFYILRLCWKLSVRFNSFFFVGDCGLSYVPGVHCCQYRAQR